ncbi:MAG: hypothetical protein KIT39_14735 [Nitrospirales bacterium]|nr:hypothetical protein [Acidobacteriota bacterium]MCW5784566.1 hypothetical protein [Nitrospirales bacterium]
MKKLIKMTLTIGFLSVVVWGTIWTAALAYTGDDPVIRWESCKLTELTARLGPDGSIRYSIMGTCYNNPITGELAYATNRQMAEQFIYRGAKFRTTAVCPDDPWISGATCEDQLVSAQGADPGHLIYQKVPLSRYVISEPQVFQHAKANATRPNPPGPPVNARAEIRGGGNATVYWLGPDQQGNFGPYLNFVVEARPKGAEGATWTKLGGINRHSAPDYRVGVKIPEPIPGFSGWELRTCATTVLARTCTGPFSPTLAFNKERLAPLIGRDKTGPPLTIQKENSTLQSSKPQIGAPQSSSPNQQGGGNAASPLRSYGKIGNVAPGNESALNPQPLPPKSFRFGSIMHRGIPEGEAPPSDVAPENEPATIGAPTDEKPAP